MWIHVGRVPVADIPEDVEFVCNGADVQAIYDTAGPFPDDHYRSFFVPIGEGEYAVIWGCEWTVPYLERQCDRLEWVEYA